MVSLIISVCNQARQLNQLLSTILKADTRHKLEIVILDQGSTDNASQVLTQYSAHFFIRYIKTAANSPLGLLRLGADKARNKYLFFLPAHIEYPADFFPRILQQKPAPRQGIFFSIEKNVASASQIRSEQKSIKEIFSYIDPFNNSRQFGGYTLGVNRTCLFCSREDFKEQLRLCSVNSIDHPWISKTKTKSVKQPKKSSSSLKINNNDQEYKKAEKTVKDLRYKLFNLGFIERAYQDLEELTTGKNSHKRRLAARELAIWHANKYTAEDSQKSLAWLSIAKKGEDDSVKIRQNAILEAECLHSLDQTKKARTVIERELKKEGHADLFLARANLEQEISARLIWINKALRLHGLSEITCKPEGKATPYDGLQAKPGTIKKSALPADAPKVTVIIPAYNAQDTISVALDSILCQTWTNLEVLVVDDCSTDGTVEVVEAYTKKDKRVRLIKAEMNQGPYVARNLALREATGEFVTVNDADDWSHPEKIGLQVRHLLENQGLIANLSQLCRVLPSMEFYRRGNPGFYIAKNFSSLMFRREPVLTQIGYWDCVRFAGDSEFFKRMKKVLGDASVKVFGKGPLSFARQSEKSLTCNNYFGFHGAFVGARRAYLEANLWWHDLEERLYIDFQQDVRPFPIPTPMSPKYHPKNSEIRHLDVVIATEIRLTGGTVASTIEEIKANRALGLQTGIVPLYRYDLAPSNNWSGKILEQIDERFVHLLVYGEEIACDLLIIRHPPVLQEAQSYLPSIKPNHIVVVVNQSPFKDYNDLSSRVYDLESCYKNTFRYFGQPGEWLPIGPAVRKALMQETEAGSIIEVADEDWVNIINIEEWYIQRKKSNRSKPVIGRHSRDQYVKWPSDKRKLLAAYPDDNNIEVKIFGGAESPKNILGYIPENWTVYPFDSIAPKDFLAEIDVFVYFTHPGWVEAFGRTPLEAMAAGVPVILPESFRVLFKNAAIYATPDEVQDIVMQLYKDKDYHQKQSETGRKFVYENFGYGQHKKRLAQFVDKLDENQVQA
jgi:glycosyltransferase involved in cell wall biosynthesis